jgi:hypothetical protein
MFLGYLRNNFEEALEVLGQEKVLLDIELLKKTFNVYPQYCFAAYENNNIVGVLSAYEFENRILINVLEVAQKYEDVLQRLVALLLKNCLNKNIYLLLEQSSYGQIEPLGFKIYAPFVRYMHFGDAVAFNFSNTHAKQVNIDNYEEVNKKIDKLVFNESRETYINKDCIFSNSLKLGTQSGILHSYVVNKKYIKISPWIMKDEAFLDAQKLLRGVLYYRGLKKIFGYAPKEDKEITELYESYKFKKDGLFYLLYLGEKPRIKLENLYAL